MAAAAAVLVTATDAGAARSSVRAGRGYRVAGGDFVGYYLTRDGAKVYCLDPDKAAPSAISLGAVARYPGASATVTAELSYALTHWGDATPDAAAAVESQVLNTLVGNDADVHRRAAEIPARLQSQVAADLRMARAFHGPYTVRLRLPNALGVGQAARGTAIVATAAGRRVRHVGLVLSHSVNATVTDWSRTDRRGVARFHYAVNGAGPVHIGATAVALPATGILMSRPKAGQQHLVAWRQRTTAHASASFEHRPGGVTISYACSTTCNGHPTLVLRACAAPSRLASRFVYRVGARTRIVTYAPSRSRRCLSASIVAGDGDRVSGAWEYRVGGQWSRPVPAPGAMVVDCPPAPAVAVAMTYDCARADVTFALAVAGAQQPLVNRTSHRMVLVIAGASDRRIYAGRGRSAVFSTTASCDAPVTYRVRSGVRRANGRYNYGPVASVTTPDSKSGANGG